MYSALHSGKDNQRLEYVSDIHLFEQLLTLYISRGYHFISLCLSF